MFQYIYVHHCPSCSISIPTVCITYSMEYCPPGVHTFVTWHYYMNAIIVFHNTRPFCQDECNTWNWLSDFVLVQQGAVHFFPLDLSSAYPLIASYTSQHQWASVGWSMFSLYTKVWNHEWCCWVCTRVCTLRQNNECAYMPFSVAATVRCTQLQYILNVTLEVVNCY